MTHIVLLLSLISIPFIIQISQIQEGLPSSCPNPTSIQSSFVRENFNTSKLQGKWYEVAYKDVFQVKGCKCQSSFKSIQEMNTNTIIRDKFILECYNATYLGDLRFELDKGIPAHFKGTWNLPIIKRIPIPDTVVDVGVDESTGNYNWIVEFQCVNGPSLLNWKRIFFYGLQIYSRQSISDVDEIVHIQDRLRHIGLGSFLDHWSPVTIADQTNCIREE